MIGDELRRVVATRAGGNKGEIRDGVHNAGFNNAGILVALQDVAHLRGSREILCKPRRAGSAQNCVERGPAQISVNKQNSVVPVARQAHRQIRRDKGLALRGHAAADKDCLERILIAKLVNLRAQPAKLLDAFAAVSKCRKGDQGWLP